MALELSTTKQEPNVSMMLDHDNDDANINNTTLNSAIDNKIMDSSTPSLDEEPKSQRAHSA